MTAVEREALKAQHARDIENHVAAERERLLNEFEKHTRRFEGTTRAYLQALVTKLRDGQ